MVERVTLQPSFADSHEIWELQIPGTLWVCSGLYRDCSNFYIKKVGETLSKIWTNILNTGAEPHP